MSDSRLPVKLDFTSGIENLPLRPKVDIETTAASVTAAQEIGFIPEQVTKPLPKPDTKFVAKVDGRRLRRRGIKVQLNLKVSEEEKEIILNEASQFIQDESSSIQTIGEFVMHVVELYRKQKSGVSNHAED